jgi:hypothetical protein
MNETPQQTNTPNNYDFITNQPGVVAKQKTSKKLVAIFILLPLTIVALLLGVLFGGDKKTSTQDQAKTIDEQFLTAMDLSIDEYQAQAYALLADNLKEDVPLAVNSLERLKTTVDFSSCSKGLVTSAASQQTVRYNCTALSGRELVLEITSNDKITAYKVK